MIIVKEDPKSIIAANDYLKETLEERAIENITDFLESKGIGAVTLLNTRGDFIKNSYMRLIEILKEYKDLHLNKN